MHGCMNGKRNSGDNREEGKEPHRKKKRAQKGKGPEPIIMPTLAVPNNTDREGGKRCVWY